MVKFEVDRKDIFTLSVIVILFVVFSYLVQNNLGFFAYYMDKSFIGMFFFVILAILEVVFAPITIIPLIALVSNIWGPVNAAILSAIGWTIGSIIAFLIARHLGVAFVEKYISLKNIRYIEEKIPKHHIFFGVIFLRLMFPIDLINYAIGFFTRIPAWSFGIAIAIAVTPLAFVFAYLGRLPFSLQIILLCLGIISLIVIYFLTEFIRTFEKDK
ncbi:MAG: TVP38/TMEM64 family protein [Minisyncoccales bacterium]